MYKAFSINISYKANTKTRQKQKWRPKDWGKDKDKKWRPIEGCYELCRTSVVMSCVIGINAKNITWIIGVIFTIEEEEEEIGISGKISLESLEFVLTLV